MKLTERSVEDFLSELASKEPVPGGGGASALVGAAGAALGSMVVNLTAGKKKYAAVEPEILALGERAAALRAELLRLVQADAEAFAPLAAAYGLPKDTEEQRAEKARVMEKVLRDAVAVPVEIMENCVEALRVTQRLARIGSRLVVSDAGCAAAFCGAALDAASLNVAINTKLMRDRACAEEIDRRAAEMVGTGRGIADSVLADVRAQLVYRDPEAKEKK